MPASLHRPTWPACLCVAALFAAALLRHAAAAEPANPASRPAPRAARSVHLGYSAPAGGASAFYIEMSISQSVPGSYFMAAGFGGGYFGAQELADGKKVILFSVWDPTSGDDPRAVPPDQRVEILHKHDAVNVKRFGGEGTGGQSFYPCDWQLDQPLKFLVRAAAHEGNKTAFAAYFHDPVKKEWVHLVTFRTASSAAGRNSTPGALRGLHSFVEDFRRNRTSATQTRRARFASVWAQDTKGEWHALRRARFTASGAEWEARDTIDAGVEGEGFYLQTGGQTKMSRELNSAIELPAPKVEIKPPAALPAGQ